MWMGYALALTQPDSVNAKVTLSAAVSAAPCWNVPLPVTVPPMNPLSAVAAILPPPPSSPPHPAPTATARIASLFILPLLQNVEAHHTSRHVANRLCDSARLTIALPCPYGHSLARRRCARGSVLL